MGQGQSEDWGFGWGQGQDRVGIWVKVRVRVGVKMWVKVRVRVGVKMWVRVGSGSGSRCGSGLGSGSGFGQGQAQLVSRSLSRVALVRTPRPRNQPTNLPRRCRRRSTRAIIATSTMSIKGIHHNHHLLTSDSSRAHPSIARSCCCCAATDADRSVAEVGQGGRGRRAGPQRVDRRLQDAGLLAHSCSSGGPEEYVRYRCSRHATSIALTDLRDLLASR